MPFNKNSVTSIPAKPSAGIPRWAVENYEGAEQAMAEDLFSAIFWSRVKRLEEETGKPINLGDELVSTKIIAASIMDAAVQSDTVADLSHRAFYLLTYQASKNNYFRLDPAEYTSASEWLSDKIARLTPGSCELYDLIFVYSNLFPMLEKMGNGWTPEKLLRFTDKWTRTRAAIPYMRNITKQFTEAAVPLEKEIEQTIEEAKSITDENTYLSTEDPQYKKNKAKVDKLLAKTQELSKEKEKVVEEASVSFKQGITKALDIITDPSTPFTGPNSIGNVLARGDDNLIVFKGYKTRVNGKTIYTMMVDEDYERAVESPLRNIVEFTVGDPQGTINEIKSMMKNK
jgi:hypothetical protein